MMQSRIRPPALFVKAVFVFVTYFICVGSINPFRQRVRIEDVAETGDGNFARQIVLLLAALVGGCALVIRNGGRPWVLIKVIPWPVLALLAWCVLTISWSPFPDIGTRRLIQIAILAFIAFAFVRYLEPLPTFRLLAVTLVYLVCLSVLLAPVLPSGIHGAERAASLSGAWRGLFVHKNHAGVAALLAVILSYFFMRMERKPIWIIGMVFGVLLLILSKSKTSLALLVPLVVCGIFVERYLRGVFSMSLTLFVVTSSSLLVLVLILVNFDALAEVLSDPRAFTGRVGIWMALNGVISDHFWGGVGYGSIYDVGDTSLLTRYGEAWVSRVGHAHNGYVELWASIGLVGLVLAVVAFMLLPLYRLLSARGHAPSFVGMLAAVIVLAMVHNMMETTLMHRPVLLWYALLIVAACADRLVAKRAIGFRRERPSLTHHATPSRVQGES